MERRLLNKVDFEKLHKAFCLAFSNYKVDMSPTLEEFDTRIHNKLNIDYELSGAAYDGNEMIGFILHTSNIYQGIPTAFNGGTGVIPGFRNQRTGEELYEYLLPKIISKSIARVLLEVIDTNEQAIRLYEKIGFSFKRRFLCYKQVSKESTLIEFDIVSGNLEDINEDFADFEPSFVDSRAQLLLGNEQLLVAKENSQTLGYLVFQPLIGRISQIAVSRIHRNRGIGRNLIEIARKESKKDLTVLNVPDDEIGFQRFLHVNGFENQVNQFEMELII